MAIGVTITVSAPIEAYDAMHAAILRNPLPDGIGLISHVARQTGAGFQVDEVWESKEAFDHFMEDILPQVLPEVLDDAGTEAEQQIEVWEIRGLVVPKAGVAI